VSTNPSLHRFATRAELGQAAAQFVTRLATQAATERGRFTVALSGGSLPKMLCPPLLAEPLRSQIDWSTWHLFWADERCVPLDHPDSNYRLTREVLFDHVDIPAGQIYPIDDSLPPVQTAQAYQTILQQVFQPEADQLPRVDLILLGMGEDGHTASLFPNQPLLKETVRWVAPVFDSPKPPPERITLTLPLINNARHVAFLAAGAGKAKILPQVLGQKRADSPLPAQRVQPVNGQLHWFIDDEAAANLSAP